MRPGLVSNQHNSTSLGYISVSNNDKHGEINEWHSTNHVLCIFKGHKITLLIPSAWSMTHVRAFFMTLWSEGSYSRAKITKTEFMSDTQKCIILSSEVELHSKK